VRSFSACCPLRPRGVHRLHLLSPSTDDIGLRQGSNGSALPRLPIIRFRRAEGFRGFTGSLSLRPVELLVSLADLTGVFPSQRRLLPPSFPTGRSPFPRSDITTVATEQAPPMGLSPIGTSAIIASLHRLLPSTGVTRLRRSYEPLRHPTWPGLPLASCQLIHTAITAGTSRVAHGPLCLHAVANTPAGWTSSPDFLNVRARSLSLFLRVVFSRKAAARAVRISEFVFLPSGFISVVVTAPIGSLKLTSISVAQLQRWQRMVLPIAHLSNTCRLGGTAVVCRL
jgi:hypothetical protein